MHIIAHRGVSAHYHENTILAFEKALEIQVYGIEVDLHQIEDQFVIFHDFQLDRLTKKRADLADLSLAQTACIRLQNNHKLPMLTDLFELVKGNCMLNLELKYIREPHMLMQQVTQYINQYNGDVVISSFNHPLLIQLQLLIRDTKLDNNIKFAALIGHLPVSMAQYAIDMRVDIAAIDAELVTREFVEHAHTHNIKVWAYTVNFEAGFKKLSQMGVDAVFSNDPALLRKYAQN
jgi:glycerophosphoryl diester phosphodiesterase